METTKDGDTIDEDIRIKKATHRCGVTLQRKCETVKETNIKREDGCYDTIGMKCPESKKKDRNTVKIDSNFINDAANIEEPIDLTFSQRPNVKQENRANGSSYKQNVNWSKTLSDRQIYDETKSNATFTISKIVQADCLIANENVPKKRGRKRKEHVEIHLKKPPASSPPRDNPEYVQIVDSRQTEVLMAAKSLFSKRTRTLYHWMYPNAPKAQLKYAVSMSWETLGVQEKEFYISQVLGRFGFPQSSLMVNPQLGGLRGIPIAPPLDLRVSPQVNVETSCAIATILDSQENRQNDTTWSQFGCPLHSKRVNRRRGHARLGRPPGSKTQKHYQLKDQTNAPVKTAAVESVSDDFQDDPELRQEYEQFKWALHMNEK